VEIILILSDSGLLVPMKQSAVGALYGIRNMANLLYYSLGVLNVIHLKWIFLCFQMHFSDCGICMC